MSALFAALLREGLTLLVLAAAPPLLAAALVGAVADLVLHRLGARDAGLPTLLRLSAGLLALSLSAPALVQGLGRFTAAVLQALPAAGRLAG